MTRLFVAFFALAIVATALPEQEYSPEHVDSVLSKLSHYNGMNGKHVLRRLQEAGAVDHPRGRALLQERFDEEVFDDRPMVLYWNRHFGTEQEFAFTGDSLGLRWSAMRPSVVEGCKMFAISSKQADVCWGQVGYLLCLAYDVIVVGDTTPDARTFLKKKCPKKMVMQITNRFDVFVHKFVDVNRPVHVEPPADMAYYEMVREASNNPNVFWAPNNPFEQAYMRWKANITLPADRYFLIRSMGHTRLAGKAVEEDDRNLWAVVSKFRESKTLLEPNLQKWNIPFKKYLPWGYGGPKTLAQHIALVHIPYQVSIMTMYENLRHGVAYLLPSSKLLRQIQGGKLWGDVVFKMQRDLGEPEWERFVEWYHEDLSDLFIYFDSFDHLRQLYDDPSTVKTLRANKLKSEQRMKDLADKTLLSWRELFDKMGYPIADNPVKSNISGMIW